MSNLARLPEPGFRIEGFDAATTVQMLICHSFAILIQCDACGRTTERPALHFAEHFGGLASLNDLADRLRCSDCGARSGLIGNAGRRRPVWAEEADRGGHDGH